MQIKLLGFVCICAALLAIPAWAHHSHGNYDIAKWTTIEGTIKEFHLINPHSWVYLQVKDDKGQTAVWALESTNLISLQRRGIDKAYFKIGEPIKVRCHQLKDGTNGCLLGFVTPMHGDTSRDHGVEKSWD